MGPDKLLNIVITKTNGADSIPGAPSVRLVSQEDVEMANLSVRILRRACSMVNSETSTTEKYRAEGMEITLKALGLWEA